MRRFRAPFRLCHWGKMLTLLATLLSHAFFSTAQVTFPVNGVADPREECYAFTHATLVKDGQTTIPNATLIIRDGLIIGAGTGLTPPKDTIIIHCNNKYIDPSFIHAFIASGI